MIVVSASLAIIGIIGLFIADDVLFADNIHRANTDDFEDCKKNNFVDERCQRYTKFGQMEGVVESSSP